MERSTVDANGWVKSQPMQNLLIATAISELPDTAAAVREIHARLLDSNARPPDFVSLHFGAARPPELVWTEATSLLPTTALHGGSSCLGVMAESGAAIATGSAIGAFVIWDSEGAYGTGMMPLASDARTAAAEATRIALKQAGRFGEAPDLVWLTAAPGQEEEVLLGVKDVVGKTALIVGGSSAANDISGGWSQMSREGVAQEAVVVSVLFPSTSLGCAFGSGYSPIGRHGTVTSAQGRTIAEIDHRPAAEVYSEWTGGSIQVPAEGSAQILMQSTMFPLGRRVPDSAGIDHHLLAHPAMAHADGRLSLFSDIAVGDQIWVMEGSIDRLVERAARIARRGRDRLGEAEVAGGLMVYCGGCMLAIPDQMNKVAALVSKELGGAPFLGVYSFGEQGKILEGESVHGNLMISCTVFATQAPPPKIQFRPDQA